MWSYRLRVQPAPPGHERYSNYRIQRDASPPALLPRSALGCSGETTDASPGTPGIHGRRRDCRRLATLRRRQQLAYFLRSLESELLQLLQITAEKAGALNANTTTTTTISVSAALCYCLLLYRAALAPLCSLGLDARDGVGPYIWPPEDLGDAVLHLAFYHYGRLKLPFFHLSHPKHSRRLMASPPPKP